MLLRAMVLAALVCVVYAWSSVMLVNESSGASIIAGSNIGNSSIP